MTTNGSEPRPPDQKARVRHAAAETADAAKRRVRSAIEQSKDSAAAAASNTAEALDGAADRLAANEQNTLSGAVEMLSTRLSSFGKYVESHSLDELLRDARRMAHRHPAAVVLGGACLGIALSRFFKASAPIEEPAANMDRDRRGDHGLVH